MNKLVDVILKEVRFKKNDVEESEHVPAVFEKDIDVQNKRVTLAIGIETAKDKPFYMDFYCEVMGVYEIDDDANAEQYLENYGLNLLFPYLRCYLSTFTAFSEKGSLSMPFFEPNDIFKEENIIK